MNNNILVIAYACEPNATSEPGVGWKLAHEIANYYPITIITRGNNKEVIEYASRNSEVGGSEKNIKWAYVDLASPFQALKKKIPFGTQLYYMLWQWKAFFHAKKLHNEYQFSIVHHLTFGVSWLTPPACLLSAPFVWGPIGGGDIVPSFIMKHESTLNRAKELGYSMFVNAAYYISPLAKIARKRSAAILFRNRSTGNNFPYITPSKKHIICETATDSPITRRNDQHTGILRAICVGRMQYWKGFKIAVEGFHRYITAGGKGTLTMLGDGPELESIKMYCLRHNLGQQVHVLGNVPAHEVQEHLRNSNTLIHPSFRDGGSWAVLEGMMNGLPIIAVDFSGSADMVSDECGFRINSETREGVIEQVARSLTRLDEDPPLRKTMGIAAQERVESHYRWDVRGRNLKSIYENILNR